MVSTLFPTGGHPITGNVKNNENNRNIAIIT